MKKKILAILLALPLFAFAYLFSIRITTIEASVDDSIYIASNDSFEHSSEESGLYYESTDKSASDQVPAGKLLGYVWTKTGDLINVFKDLCNINDAKEKSTKTNPLTQTPGTFLKAGNETISTIFKTLGLGQEALTAAHHPWIFLFAITFGTISLLLWFLRLTTGVSPPIYSLRLLRVKP